MLHGLHPVQLTRIGGSAVEKEAVRCAASFPFRTSHAHELTRVDDLRTSTICRRRPTRAPRCLRLS